MNFKENIHRSICLDFVLQDIQFPISDDPNDNFDDFASELFDGNVRTSFPSRNPIVFILFFSLFRTPCQTIKIRHSRVFSRRQSIPLNNKHHQQ